MTDKLSMLDQWEAEAKHNLGTHEEAWIEDAEKILALIDLVRKKDEALAYYAGHCPPFVSVENAYAPAAGRAKQALALTEELK